MKKLNSQKGFTLIELLIVIAIIAVLAVAFLPSLLGAPAKARDTQRTTQTQKIAGFLLAQSLASKTLPGNAATGEAQCLDAAGASTSAAIVLANVADLGGTFPKDPKSDNVTTGSTTPCTGTYGYIRYKTGLKYTVAVFAAVENISNANILCKDIDFDVDPVLKPGVIATDAASANCLLVPIQ